MATEQVPIVKTLVTVAGATSTATSAAFSIPMADCWSFYLKTTAVGTSPTMDIVFLTSVDGGTTYINIPWRFAQVTTISTNVMTVKNGFAIGEVGVETATAATGGTLQSPCVIDPNFMQITYTLGGTTPHFSFILYVIALQKMSARQQ